MAADGMATWYRLTETISRHGGDTRKIDLTPFAAPRAPSG